MWSNCKGSAFIYHLFILPFMLLFSSFWEVMGGGISELEKKAYFSLLKFIVLKKLNLSFLKLHLNFSNKILILSHFFNFSYFYCHSSILFIVSSCFLGHMSRSSLTSLSFGLPFPLPSVVFAVIHAVVLLCLITAF